MGTMADERLVSPPRDSSEAVLGFDQLMDRLRQVVSRLEQGNLSLEQSLLSFEEGIKLSRRGAEILDLAERRIEILVRGEDGSDQAQPFNPALAQSPAALQGSEGDGRT